MWEVDDFLKSSLHQCALHKQFSKLNTPRHTSKCSVSKLVNRQMTYMNFWIMFNVIWFTEILWLLSYLRIYHCKKTKTLTIKTTIEELAMTSKKILNYHVRGRWFLEIIPASVCPAQVVFRAQHSTSQIKVLWANSWIDRWLTWLFGLCLIN